jgi:uncharacterized lipoprotein
MRLILPIAAAALLAACSSSPENEGTALNSTPTPALADASHESDVAR